MALKDDLSITKFREDQLSITRGNGGLIMTIRIQLLNDAGSVVSTCERSYDMTPGETQVIVDYLSNHMGDFAAEEDLIHVA